MRRGRRANRETILLVALIIAATAAVLLAMGRPLICTCGTIKLWEGAVNSSGNSQHLADWYSFSHVIHGFLFYAGTWWLLRRRVRVGDRFALAVLIEAAWEIAENSPFIIDRYRTATAALGYTGDSVLNSMSDIAMMAAGFLFAAKMPPRLTIAVAIGFELFTLWAIRDNLTLNVLMLTFPLEAIKSWQGQL
ncbi:MAG: DUF2585 domain-containing protein [Sphingobium sp.]